MEIAALILAVLALLVALAAGSEIRRVGDDVEYLDMMQDLLRFEAPSRYAQFWFYPALAVPFISLIAHTSLSPFAAFIPLNFVLLAAAFFVDSGVLTRPGLALIFVTRINTLCAGRATVDGLAPIGDWAFVR